MAAVVVMCVVTSVTHMAFPHSLTVPFFRDDGGAMGTTGPATGGAGVITVRNTRDTPITMYLVYGQKDGDGGTQIQQAVPYTIVSKGWAQWRPVKDDAAEGAGRAVPNMLPGLGDFGSVVIYWTGDESMSGALIGRYAEYSPRGSMMHVLVENE